MPNYDVVCLGMAVCDILAGPVDASIFDRDTTKVPSIEMRSGGDAMTQAVISSRLGCKTALASKVGNDAMAGFTGYPDGGRHRPFPYANRGRRYRYGGIYCPGGE